MCIGMNRCLRTFPCLCAVILSCALMALPVLAAMYDIPDSPVPLAGTNVRTPVTGSVSSSGGGATIDYSNTSEGYVMVRYSGSASKIKVQITKSGGTTYTYNLRADGQYEVFPLTAGNGSYTVNVFENVSGTQYAMAHSVTAQVDLKSSTLPFLYPSQYVNFNADSKTVKKGADLAKSAASDLDAVTNIYNFVISNISYDTNKATTVTSGYLPKVDSVLDAGKGICFDYAAVMAAMLRSQNIPTKLEVGYVSGGIYHAWISVYITDVGWINGLIYFDGTSWKLMDPTFASSGNQGSDIMKFIGNGGNYSTMYVY